MLQHRRQVEGAEHVGNTVSSSADNKGQKRLPSSSQAAAQGTTVAEMGCDDEKRGCAKEWRGEEVGADDEVGRRIAQTLYVHGWPVRTQVRMDSGGEI